jgi:Sugar (and other) transporter.
MNAELILPRRTFLDMNAYQWSVIFAAWLGWGFDVFDSLLMNYVAPNAVPTLLGIPLGTPAAQSATLWWTGVLTSILLLGWCAGGIIFGKVTDRIGRTRTLLLTMMLYAVGRPPARRHRISGSWSSAASYPL